MSIYTDLLNAARKGKKFKVDLINKSLWIDKKQIIKEGEIVNEQDKSKEFIEEKDCVISGWVIPYLENPWDMIEMLYDDYNHSVPRENGNKKSYFKALSVDELTDNELAFNISRDFAQACLEGYILLARLQELLKWKLGSYWFWKSENYENLVILKEWIE